MKLEKTNHSVQGFYFSRPLDEEKALDFIRKTNV